MSSQPHEPLGAPGHAPDAYRVGERVTLTGPGGETYLARVDHVSDRSPSGSYTIVAAIIHPRRHRGSVVVTEVS
jgi:hypothetical protein